MASSRRLSGDNGAVIVEAALILPVLVTFCFGTLELGYMLKNSLVVTNAMRSAVRTDANVLSFSARRYADYSALDTYRVAASGTISMTMQRIVIYKPSAANGTPPALCLSTATSPSGAGVNGVCNIFSATQLASLPQSSFGSSATSSTCGGTDWDRWWCPPTRANTISGGLDTVCIYVAYTYTYVTKVLPGTSRTITDRACIQVEPQV